MKNPKEIFDEKRKKTKFTCIFDLNLLENLKNFIFRIVSRILEMVTLLFPHNTSGHLIITISKEAIEAYTETNDSCV